MSYKPYKYQAAAGYQAPQRKTTTGGSSPAYGFAAPSTYGSGTTHEQWYAAQAPTIHASPAMSAKEVRFASPDMPSGFLYPGDRDRDHRRRRAESPFSQGSAYMPSPLTPPLSHCSDAGEDFECPPTPLLKPRPLEPETQPSLFDSNAHIYAAYAEIERVLDELNTCVSSFHLPTELDFEPDSTLTYTAKNRPFLEQIQRLERLQSMLDAVESYGYDELRKTRKAAGAKIDRAFVDLRRVQESLWAKRVHEQRRMRRV